MPKSSKHKKERAADFKKAKLKLGKGKQVASNATNTSFTAKSIALPNQSLAEAPKEAPTSRRNLTLPELLVQSRHYSVPVKREALTEILQLLEGYPFLLHQNLLPTITSIAHLVADASPSVRAASLALLRHIADSLPTQSLVSVSQGLILFTLSALSSLDDGVRIDALKVLDLLLEKIPEAIVRGWDGAADVHAQLGKGADEMGTGSKVVEGLLGMLKIRNPALAAAQGGFTTASSSDLSPSARLAVLSTLAAFLRTSLSPVASTSTAPPPWYLAPSFESPRAYSTFVASFGSTSSPSPVVDFDRVRSIPIEHFAFAIEDTSIGFSLGSCGLFPILDPATPLASTSAANGPPQTLLTLLHPTLLSSFLDAAPTAFSPTPALGQSAQAASAELRTITAVLRVARELFYRDLGGSASPSLDDSNPSSSASSSRDDRSRAHARKLLLALLSHAAPYFPFGSDELHERTRPEEEQLLQLNLTFAELVSLLVLSEEQGGSAAPSTRGGGSGDAGDRKKKDAKKAAKAQGDASKMSLVLSTVQTWVSSALLCTLTTTSHPLGLPPLSVEAFTALEPTLWSLLNQKDREGVEQVWKAVLDGWSKMPREGEARRRAFEFIARAILIQTDPAYTDRFDLDNASHGHATQKWVFSLPKWLWELGTKQTDSTELVLAFLLKLAQQDTKGVLPDSTLPSLAPMLVPFFHLSHPSRGSMPGPFTKLPPSIQSKALDLASYLVGVRDDDGDESREQGGQGAGADGEGRKKLGESVAKAVVCKGVDETIEARWTNLSRR
ncbi:hypothetical protein JCM10212_003682 [Sporobolomyces blumeae]